MHFLKFWRYILITSFKLYRCAYFFLFSFACEFIDLNETEYTINNNTFKIWQIYLSNNLIKIICCIIIIIVWDGHIEFPYYRLFFDKSNKRSIKLATAVTWSNSNLNMMNIYEESTLNFWICLAMRGIRTHNRNWIHNK
jgi:hypothetical protein